MTEKIELINLDELDPSKNKIDVVFKKIISLIEKANSNEDKELLISTNNNLNSLNQEELLNYLKKNQKKKIPHYWLHEIHFTPKINTLEKYFINKNNFLSKEEFVKSYFKWIKENCYVNKKEWKGIDGGKREYLYKPEKEVEGLFGIFIYNF